MVSLIIISVGLLGIASMEGLALSSGASARGRSLAAIEAASLAATMHTNRAFWSTQTTPLTVTIVGPAITADSTTKLTQGVGCSTSATTPACTPDQLAAYDTNQWVVSVNALLPNPAASIDCPNGLPPLSCTIKISWTENVVNINKQQAAVAKPKFETNTYTLSVQP